MPRIHPFPSGVSTPHNPFMLRRKTSIDLRTILRREDTICLPVLKPAAPAAVYEEDWVPAFEVYFASGLGPLELEGA